MHKNSIESIVNQIEILYNSGDLLQAKSFGIQLRNNPDLLNDAFTYSLYLQYMANASHMLSDFVDAIYFYEEAIRINKDIDNKERLAAAFGNIGLTKYRIADYSGALEYLEHAIALNQESGNNVFLAYNLGNVGIVFNMLSDYDKAFEYHDKALSINKEINNLKGIGSNLGNIGLLFQNQKKYEDALTHYQKALDIHLQIEDKEGVAISYENIGTVFIELEEYDKSLEYFQKAFTIYSDIHNKHGIANVHGQIGRVFLHLKEYEKAIKSTSLSLEIALEIEHRQAYMKSLQVLSEIHESLGDYKEALKYHKEFISIRDVIESDETKRRASLFDQQRKIEEEDKARQLRIARMEEQEKLLHTILPTNIADRILRHESFIADYYPSVSVMFMDIVGFTELSSVLSPKQLVYLLDIIFSKADEILEDHGMEKIKTIGDGYLAVANLTKPIDNHEITTASVALTLLESLNSLDYSIFDDFNDEIWKYHTQNIQLRIGLHSGEVVAGIVGKNKFIFDLWGDAVNIASRMESQSEPGKIQVSDSFASSVIQYSQFTLIPRGSISIKGKGELPTWWLTTT